MEAEECKTSKHEESCVKGTPKSGVGAAPGLAKAVIGGLACRLPNSRNVQEYWENLVGGVDMIGPSRWPEGLYDLPPRIGAILEEDKFDADFFNITTEEDDKPKPANNMNPMLRHLLEVVHECVVDSCLPLSALQEATTGLYLATFGSDYDCIETSKFVNHEHVSVSPYLAGEVARSLKIQGPSVTVDTACSSSISALNMAVNAIVDDRCTYAIVASCNQILNPLFSQQMFLLNMLCKEGQSRVFDKDAAGYVRAEGFGAILLAGDPSLFPRVYANIRGVGINCDGYKPKGITYPNSQTQAKLLRKVYKEAGIDVHDVKYVEAHGTGTQAGDTMETEGIEQVFCVNPRTEPLLIGSVKSNIGHSEATAGLASIIKCIMCMKHGEIPANLNFQEPNPGIAGIANGTLKVVDQNTPLDSKYVGVNSFGFGGVNGHVILEAYREVKDQDEFEVVPRHLLVPLTVRNQEGVTAVAEFVSNNRYNASLLSMLPKSLLSTDIRQPVRGYIQIGPKEEDFVVCSETWEEDQPSVYLLLDGLLSNKVMVGADLLENEVFMRTLKDCSKSIKKVYPVLDIISVLKKGEPLSSCTRVGILAAAALLITLLDWLEQAGVTFEGMVGCGLTEVIGAYLDACLSLDQCFSIMDIIGRELERFATEAGDRWSLYDVTMDVEDVYRLGPWVQVLSKHDTDHVTIAMEMSHKDEVLKRIHSRGGVFDQLPCTIPLYSDFMVDLGQSIKKQISEIVPAPRYWSSSYMSGHHGLYSTDKNIAPQRCDADYLSRLVYKSTDVYTATKHLPEDRLLLKLVPTTTLKAVYKPQARRSHLSQNLSMMVEVSNSPCSKSMGSEGGPRSGKGLSGQSFYKQSGLDESLSEDSYNCEKFPVNLQCLLTTETLCRTLGELHMAGYQLNVSMLYPKTTGPLGIDGPSLSPLVTWDHSVKWDMPHWLEFSSRKKDQEFLFNIRVEDDEKQRNPVAVMLFEVWQALTYKLATPETQTEDDLVSGVKLYDLVIPEESTLTTDRLEGAFIQILPKTEMFAVIADEDVLMSGKFKIELTFPLPSVPGYDLDINENVQTSPGRDRDDQCEKHEIKWEDFWERFISECVDFASLYLEPPLREFTVDWEYNQKEAKECSVFLAVVDKFTGICRSGGCALQYDPVLPTVVPELTLNQVAIDNPEWTAISKLMVYNLGGNQATVDRVIVCQADKDMGEISVPVLNMINRNGDMMMREISLPAKWQPEDLEVVVPYLLASHILYAIAEIQDYHKVLVLPPIDSVGIYVISLASTLGCSVFTSTYDIESLQTLESMFPFIRVIHGERLYEDLVTLTRGEGVDVCVRVSGGETQTALKYVAKNGHLIQGIPPTKGSSQGLKMYNRSCRVSIFQPLEAVASFMEKNTEEAEVLLFDMKSESVSQLSTEGFPEPKGILYSQENVSNFLQPIALDKLIALVTEPNLGNITCDLMEADIICVEKIQNLVAPRPKDYSIADTSCVMKTSQTTVAKLAVEDTLDRGMLITPERSTIDFSAAQHHSSHLLGTRARQKPQDLMDCGLIMTPVPSNNKRTHRELSPEVNIISMIVTAADTSSMSPEKVKQRNKASQHFTSTPLVGQACSESYNKALEESYIDSTRDGGKVSEPVTDDKENDDKEIRNIGSQTGQEGRWRHKPGMTPKRSKVPPPAIVLTDFASNSQRLPLSPSRRGLNSPRSKQPPQKEVSSFQQLMKQKSKLVPPQLLMPKPQVDLLKVGVPMTPMTPALKEILTPRMESNLVPLNTVKATAEVSPLYIVHPVTGSTSLLELLGQQLKIPCVGIKRTGATPSDTIGNVASFYRNAITLTQPEGPYKICGYSFGTLIAFEIALQLQAAGQKVEQLIFLDGSPMYVQAQITSGLKHLPTSATKAQIDEALEVGSLVNWMKLYGVTQKLTLTYGMLRKIPPAERILTAVDLTFGNAVVSSNKSKTKWLVAKEKLLQQRTSSQEEKKDQFADAAKEIMRHMRQEKASIFMNHVIMSSHYQIQGKFDGDIHLHRVKSSVVFEAVDLPADYGVSKLCQGQVSVKFYDGDHESFLSKDRVPILVEDLHTVLGVN